MSKQPKDKRPYLPPVTRIELSENHIRGRWILLILLVCIAAGAIGFGIHYAMDVQPGWNEVKAACDEPNYSSEFHLMYDFSATGGDAAAVNKGLSLLYSNVMENAYRLFSKDANVNGFHNLYYLNDHVNEAVTLEPDLYQALSLLKTHNNRCIFLAPVYVEYNRVFNSESDAEAMLYDPAYDEEAAAYISQIMKYVGNSNEVDLELLDNNMVRLHVSDSYLAFAQEYGIESFVDLAWMRNAFVIDYAADNLREQGYTSGYLSSYDGYTRALVAGSELDFNIFDRQGMDIYAPAKMTYAGPMSIVFLRDYPLSDLDRWSYHVYGDGTITSTMIHPDTGICGTSVPNLVCYGSDKDCAEILMEMIPVMFEEGFRDEQLTALVENGIYAVWCKDGTLYHDQPDILLELLENEQIPYYKTAYIS